MANDERSNPIERIAKDYCQVETLDSRCDDDRYCGNITVHSLKMALVAAYDAGALAGMEATGTIRMKHPINTPVWVVDEKLYTGLVMAYSPDYIYVIDENNECGGYAYDCVFIDPKDARKAFLAKNGSGHIDN